MTATYEPINTQTLGTAVADVYLTSIPQTYTDLVLVISSKSALFQQIGYRLNSDNGSNYSYTQFAGTGSSAASQRASSDTYGKFNWYGGSGNQWGVTIVHFMNYSNTTTNKTCIARGNALAEFTGADATVSLWRSTSAITAINILGSAGANFSIGSTFTLYGIKAE
jgi:hypothetical protein